MEVVLQAAVLELLHYLRLNVVTHVFKGGVGGG